MSTRKCDSCGEEKKIHGGKVCTRASHFICENCYYRHGSTNCPICREKSPLR